MAFLVIKSPGVLSGVSSFYPIAANLDGTETKGKFPFWEYLILTADHTMANEDTEMKRWPNSHQILETADDCGSMRNHQLLAVHVLPVHSHFSDHLSLFLLLVSLFPGFS